MIQLETIRSSLAELESRASSATAMVAVFSGGTSGIGEAAVKALAARVTNLKLYIIGRNEAAANRIIAECEQLSPSSTFVFLKKDLSLLKNVDEVCAKIAESERSLDLLFMSQGYLSVRGRNETAEGIDTLLALRYYSRMRMTVNLLPLLDSSVAPRVLSIFAPGAGESALHLDDLELKKNYGIFLGISHASLMTTFFFEELSKRYPKTSFLHVYPGNVITDEFKNGDFPYLVKLLLLWVLVPIVSMFCLSLEEVGDRMAFFSLSARFPASASSVTSQSTAQSRLLSLRDGVEVAKGIAGDVGSGGYCVNWTGEEINNLTRLGKLRAMNATKTVWNHTMNLMEEARAR